ncbi:dna replication regulator sld3 [Diplodia corticola]|uniref:Dna replication regulator sld3 n=1 Tax=Diplodia corticola TaxID=236234 RepID=A0A1J9REW8_9PEZI|nr:dna replication regulator sld3 [Diplodia corticola]OJD38626.1 dna replication regulator sld3 [Diplodia corticola]
MLTLTLVSTPQPCPTLPFDQPITLTPVKLIDRSQLPLSFLDLTNSPSAALPSTRLFSAHIEALERHTSPDDHHDEHDDHNDDHHHNGREHEDPDPPATPKVLVTRLSADGSLHAVERVRRGVYALCKLGAWVREEHIGGGLPALAAAGLPYARPRKALRREEDGRHWWRSVAVDVADRPAAAAAGRGGGHASSPPPPPRLSVRRAVPVPVPVPDVVGAPPPSRRLDEADPFVDEAGRAPVAGGEPPVEGVEDRPRTAEEVFQTVVRQYLQALYLTKTSLAFFVKGPMSRARAAFMSKENAGLKMGDLAAFVRSILLQPGPMDKKHREKLPEIVKAMPLLGLSDDEDAVAAKVAEKKKSKSKRLKPNKEGLYPGEDDHVKEWWLQDRHGSSPHGHSESPADVLKRRLGDLRVRESMAQVILVLEVMALEASPSFQVTEQDDTQPDEAPGEPQAAPIKKRKPKKPQDLNVLLDLLLDRLCIWQSVEQDETLVKVPKSSNGKNDTLTPSSGKSETSDKLKNFCVEVILPFYMSRLPEKAAAINKRLGGPSASPAKTSGSSSSTHRSKPGEAAVRTDPRTAQKKRRPLARVATENAAHQPQRHPPSLTRSSTDPLLLPPNLKREGGDAPSLSSIPLQQLKDSSQTSSSRNSLSQFERFARRTIDLNAMAKTNEAKLRKKEHVERELEKAIGTLRKPNRGAALKEVADSSDSRRQLLSRSGGGGSSSSKPGAPVSRKAGGGAVGGNNNTVLVGATPKRGKKTKDVVLQATPNHNRFVTAAAVAAAAAASDPDVDDDGDDADMAPETMASSEPVIPSSAVRPGPVDFGLGGGYTAAATIPGSVVKKNNDGMLSSMSAPGARSSGGGGVEETPSRGPAGKTVHWLFPPPAAATGTTAAAAVGATPEAKGASGSISRLGEKLKASAGRANNARGGSGGLKVPPPLPPSFKSPGRSVSGMGDVWSGRGVEEEGSEESEDDGYRGVSALMRTPTKPGRGQVLETPVKRAGALVGETPVKKAATDVERGARESKGKEKEVVEEVEEGGLQRIEEEEEGAEDIYNALGWDDDIDELA